MGHTGPIKAQHQLGTQQPKETKIVIPAKIINFNKNYNQPQNLKKAGEAIMGTTGLPKEFDDIQDKNPKQVSDLIT